VQTRSRITAFLVVILAVSGATVAARAIFGPFRFLLSVSNPINAEAFFGLAAILLIILNTRGGTIAAAGNARGLLPLVILAACGLAAWAWTFGFPFIADDYVHISNAMHASARWIVDQFTVPAPDRFFRPFGYIAYAAEARLFGRGPVPWHAFSFALHLVNSALVFLLAGKLGLRTWPSLAGALLFLLHGSRPEAVAWVSAQFDLWATLFFLLALLAFLGQRQIVPVVFLLLALLSKESAYVLPVVLLVLTPPNAMLRRVAPSFIVTAVVFVYRSVLLHGIGGYRMPGSNQSFFLSVSLFRTAKAIFLRLPAVLFFPINWTHHPQWWLASLLTAAMIAILVFVSRAFPVRRPIWIALAFTLITAAPVHQFLAIGPDLEKARVLYLPSVGFAVLFAAALSSLHTRVAAVIAATLLSFQTAALEHNLFIWRGIADLARNTCETAARAQPSALSDVPNVIDGVYFLHTGLRPCVEWAAGKPPATTAQGPALVWDDRSRMLVPQP